MNLTLQKRQGNQSKLDSNDKQTQDLFASGYQDKTSIDSIDSLVNGRSLDTHGFAAGQGMSHLFSTIQVDKKQRSKQSPLKSRMEKLYDTKEISNLNAMEKKVAEADHYIRKIRSREPTDSKLG